MPAFSFSSLVTLLSIVRLIAAVSLVSRPGSRVHSRPDDSGCPAVVDASDAELEVANRVIAPDGFPRSATLAGGTFPGPIIKAHKGCDFSINVVNKLSDPTMELMTTIHWHGIVQNRSNWADGVSFVTQCPIQPGESFRYRFNTQNQTGTYWYHSHHESQYCDGLRGPLIIYDPDDPHAHLYDVDDENTIITLADWWHIPARNVLVPFTPDATTINGKGRYSGGPKTPLSVVNVEHGKRYRFRIVAASCDAWHNFTIDGHRMSIIEVDGVEVAPTEVDWLQILAGQRYSVVVSADQPVDNYWIRALPNHGNQTFIDGQNSAILRYAGAPTREPTTIQGPVAVHFNENQLHPLDHSPPPGGPELGKADVVLHLVPGSDNESFYVNGIRFQPPPAPILLQILSGARHPSELLPSGSVYELPRNKVIEVHMAANDLTPGGARGTPHGIHLHGHNFHVIRTSANSTANFINPVIRDVVSMGSQAQHSNITFRFVTDNPGPWIMHCHIDFHLIRGFALVMAEALGEAATQQNNVLPSAWNDLCPVALQEEAALFNTTGHFNVTALSIAAAELTTVGKIPTPFGTPSLVITSSQTVSGTTPQPAIGPSLQTAVGGPQPAIGPTLQTALGGTLQPFTGPTLQTTLGGTPQPAIGPTLQIEAGTSTQTAVGGTPQPAIGPSLQTTVGVIPQPSIGPTLQTAIAGTLQPVIGPTLEIADGASTETVVGGIPQPSIGVTLQTTVGEIPQPAIGPTLQIVVGGTPQPVTGPTL